jgi:hypothetical protein
MFVSFLVARLSERPDRNQSVERGLKSPALKKSRANFADECKLRRGKIETRHLSRHDRSFREAGSAVDENSQSCERRVAK